MLHEIISEVQSKPKRLIDRTNFQEFFEESYRKEIEWRMQRGGNTEEEVRRVAENMPEHFKEKEIISAYMQIKHAERDSQKKALQPELAFCLAF